MVDAVGKAEDFIKRCRGHIEKENSNCVIIIIGKPGTGKSYLAMELSDKLDNTFQENLRKRICFTGNSFLWLLKFGNLKSGNSIMLDEAGVTVFNRNFFDFMNKAIVFVIQTFRHRNLYLILTVPSLAFIDSHVLRLIDYVIETKKIIKSRNQCKVKIFRVQHNPKQKKNYYKYIKKPYKTFESKKLVKFYFNKPRFKLVKQYEKLAEKYKLNLASKLYDQATYQDKVSQIVDIPGIGQKVLDSIEDYKTKRGNISTSAIELDYNVGGRYSNRVAEWVRRRLNSDTEIIKRLNKLIPA